MRVTAAVRGVAPDNGRSPDGRRGAVRPVPTPFYPARRPLSQADLAGSDPITRFHNFPCDGALKDARSRRWYQ